jgi:hypothetical protein
VQLYDAWEKKDQVEKWRKKLEAARNPAKAGSGAKKP